MSLPIPTRMPSPTCFGDISGGLGRLVEDLSRGRHSSFEACHLDPDLDLRSLPRTKGWRGSLGQVGAAQSHLRNNQVGAGDIFLFWGLYQTAVRTHGWHFVGAREHRIFGWLQVESVIHVNGNIADILDQFPWLHAHPHIRKGWPSSNTVYVGTRQLQLAGKPTAYPGWGLFRHGIRLTDLESKTPSLWRVPDWLNPKLGGVGLTYHPEHRWHSDGRLQSAARGQEFVADTSERPDATRWLREVFRKEA